MTTCHLVGELVRAHSSRAGVAAYKGKASWFLERQCSALVLQQHGARSTNFSYEFVVVVHDINVLIRSSILREECIEVGRRVRWGILTKKIPGCQDAGG
jgi:hypothetical protein